MPVVMIHGLFGWGEKRPLFGLLPTYFPLKALRDDWCSGPVIAVDVGVGSSDHDRACEAFAQLLGRRVDYGEAHACKCGHERFGPDFTENGLLPQWGPAHPVHLIGHSFGGNTALTLFNLLAEDFWGLGTSSGWIVSITTICSPMHGCSFPFVLGLIEPAPPGESPIRRWSPLPFITHTAGVLFWLQLFYPSLDPIYGFRMRQWRTQDGLLGWVKSRNAYWTSGDNMLSEATPLKCRERLRGGLQHLAKVHLIAVVADRVEPISPGEALRLLGKRCACVAPLCCLLLWAFRRLRHVLARKFHTVRRSASLVGLLTLVLGVSGARRLAGERATLHELFYHWVIRPMMRLSSCAVFHAAASLSGNSGALVGGAENDGFIDLYSQNGLDAPVMQAGRSADFCVKANMSSNMLAAMSNHPPRMLAMTRTYSEVMSKNTDGAVAKMQSEKGKWHIMRIAGADHSMGTIMSIHSREMYSAVFRVLEGIKPSRLS